MIVRYNQNNPSEELPREAGWQNYIMQSNGSFSWKPYPHPAFSQSIENLRANLAAQHIPAEMIAHLNRNSR